MVDLIVDKDLYSSKCTIYEIKNGTKEKVEEIKAYDYGDVIEFINTNYDYARILCGKCIY